MTEVVVRDDYYHDAGALPKHRNCPQQISSSNPGNVTPLFFERSRKRTLPLPMSGRVEARSPKNKEHRHSGIARSSPKYVRREVTMRVVNTLYTLHGAFSTTFLYHAFSYSAILTKPFCSQTRSTFFQMV